MNVQQRVEAELQQTLTELRSGLRDLAESAERVATEIDERGERARVPEAVVRGAGVRVDVLCERVRFLRQLREGLAA